MIIITIERALLEKIIEKFAACGCEVCTRQSIEALKAALAAPATAPEPVAWMSPKRFYRTRAMALTNGEQLIEPLYLHPPATAPAHTEAEVQELMEFAKHHALGTFSDATIEDKFRRVLGVPKP